MKTKIYLLLMLQILSYEIFAGSISGEISYSGSAAGSIIIAAFNNPALDNDPEYMVSITQPGSYTLNDVIDGTYFIVSIISENPEHILPTDPYGFWGTLGNLTPVVISGSNNVEGININLIDGTIENPNPFAEYYVEPDVTIQLPQTTEAGVNPSLVFDGTSILLYKHDYEGAASAKIFAINPESGVLSNTYLISLESSPNKISWIDKMVYRNGVLWGNGGYGDPLGYGGIEGIFKINIFSSTSSNQLPLTADFEDASGLACDGTNFFIGYSDSMGVDGIVKFNPDDVSVVPSDLFINLDKQIRYLSYGNNSLWVGINKINKFNPVSGEYLEDINLPGLAAELFFDNKFWSYDEVTNSIKVYYLSSLSINQNSVANSAEDFSLSQNYPNPFNPKTSIQFTISNRQFVTLKIYNVLGNEISTLINEEKSVGNYEVAFDAAGLSSGIYFYKLQIGNSVETRKMILMK